MSYHTCHKCGKHGDISWSSTGFRQAFLATCDREDCPQTLAPKRFAAMFEKQELPPDERNEK